MSTENTIILKVTFVPSQMYTPTFSKFTLSGLNYCQQLFRALAVEL